MMNLKRDPDMFSQIIFLFLFLCCFVLHLAAPCILRNNITSLYQLGDSIADTGNEPLFRLPNSRRPYGETYPGFPTGRWSDGRLIIDYIAKALGLPLLHPSSAINALSSVNGVNFAYGGSTALDFAFYRGRRVPDVPIIPSLNVQLKQFKRYLGSICSPTIPGGCANELRQSLVFVGEFGYNDIGLTFSSGRSTQKIRSYIPLVTQAILNATREVLDVGASQVVVPGNFPLGCFPGFLLINASDNLTVYDEDGCLKSLNDLATFQNYGLQRGIHSLRREFPNATLLYADYYNAFLSVLREAPTLGFDTKNLFKPCCGEGKYNLVQGPGFCGNSLARVCSDPNAYIHWDGIHPTQAAYSHISGILIKDLGIKPRSV